MEFSSQSAVYALLAANVYGATNNDASGTPRVRSELNTLPLPSTDWVVIAERVSASGFMARAYRDVSTGKVVIAYAGTTDETNMDWSTGNIPAATGLVSEQVVEAAEFYMDVLNSPYGQSAEISFTGHSLGGGLASLMAVYFDRRAIVFDQAPFEKSADSALSVNALKAALTVHGYLLPDSFAQYIAVDPVDGVFLPSPSRLARESNVDRVFVTGEALSLAGRATTDVLALVLASLYAPLGPLALSVDKIYGDALELDVKARSGFGWEFVLGYDGGNPVDLHSMSLLAGILLSEDFFQAIQEHSELLARIFAGPYAEITPKDPVSTLLELLVQRHLAGENALDVLAADIGKISTQALGGNDASFEYLQGGKPVTMTLAAALVDAVLAGMYAQGNNRDREQFVANFHEFLTVGTGSLRFDAGELGKQASKGLAALEDYLKQASGGVIWNRGAIEQARWIVQNSTGGISTAAPADDRSDVIIGVSGANAFLAGGGDDFLVGGTGADDLTGDAGSDYLIGGAGADTYRFYVDDSTDVTVDTVIDSDGSGWIYLDDAAISAGERISDNAWYDASKKAKLTVVSGSQGDLLVISILQTGDSIRVMNWHDGDLGITLAGNVPSNSLNALTGDDDLFGTAGNNTGDDRVDGLAGNDGLEGGAGDDHLDGGAGNDLILGGIGDDVLIGGEGNDYIYDGYEQADFAELDTTPDPDTGKSQVDEFNDKLAELGAAVRDHGKAWIVTDVIFARGWTNLDPNGTSSGDDVIDAGAGNDTVVAGDGDDTMRGGSGQDRLVGGADNDIMFGEADDDIINGDYPDSSSGGDGVGWRSSDQANRNGNDVIDGGGGNDTIRGNGGSDILAGGDDNDRIWGRGLASPADADDADKDYLDGGAGSDQLVGDDGDDVLLGGAGDDSIWGDNNQAGTRHGDDNIDAGAGNDFASGDGGDDIIAGGAGSDTLTGDSVDLDGSLHGRDLIHGGADNDIIDGNGGDDTLYGDEGDDQLLGDQAANESLAATFHGNDYLDGGVGNDLLIGNGGNDQLVGGSGLDELQGGEGDDRLDGGEDDDILYGEAGSDSLVGGAGDDKLYAGAGNDRLDGGTGVDILGGGQGEDVLDGGDGDDTLDGEAGKDTIFGGAGNDTIDGDDGDDLVYGGTGNDSIYGGTGNDVIHAEDGNDIVTAAEGDDVVFGGAGSDNLFGSEGNDTLHGEDGDDYLVGGAGNDTLVGGAGLNRYYFDRQFGQDVVQLAAGSQDQIYLRDGIAAEEVSFVRDQDDLLLSLADGSSLRLSGYFTQDTAAWIQFANGSWISRAVVDSGIYYGAISGGSANGETLEGTEGDDRLYGLGGDDTIDGLGGNDLIDGGEGNDTLTDGQGDDQVFGGAGNDVINLVYNGGGNGVDRIDGGAGNDTYNINWLSGYDVIENLDAANAGSDIINLVGITQNMVTNYQVDGSNLFIFVAGNSPGASADNIIVLEGFLANSNHRVRFAEGVEISGQDFQSATWTGTEGDDTYNGTIAPDTISGRGGNDTLSGGDSNDQIYGGIGDDVLYGGNGNDALYGEDGNDIVYAGEGDDRIYMAYTGSYVDRYIGGSGNDSYFLNYNYSWTSSPYTATTDAVEEAADGGTDTLYTNFYHARIGANIENLVYTPANFWWPDIPAQLIGNSLGNVLQVVAGSLILDMPSLKFRFDGGGGKDTYMGTAAQDTYVVDSADDTIIEQQTGYDSIDTVETSLDYSIETRLDLENIRLTGTATTATGNSDDNVLEGHLVNGVTHLSGLGGNDTYLVTRQDVVIEAAGGGNDTVVIAGWDELTTMSSWFSLSDYAHVENLTLGDAYEYGTGVGLRGNLQGDDGDNVLKGNKFSNEIHGGGGNDVIWGNAKNPINSEVLISVQRDVLYGEAGDDTIMSSVYGADLYGGAGNDLLIGVGGAYLSGNFTSAYGGNDRYFYDVGGGTDTIRIWNGVTSDYDQVIFGEGVDPDQVTWAQEGTQLVIQVGSNPDDRVIVEGYWREDAPGVYSLTGAIDAFVFADGTVRHGDIDQLPYTNNPPVANGFTIGEPARTGEFFELALPPGTFVDEPGDVLTYTMSGPSWMSIDPATGTLSGTPPQDADNAYIVISATDTFGQSATIYLDLRVIAVIKGTEGADELQGSERSEELRGLGGNDRLVSNGGNDVMYGGTGDDTYVLNTGAYVTVVEQAGEGIDTVEFERDSYIVDANIERAILMEGSEARVAYGTDGAQTLIGNTAANYLDGGAGADRMEGGLGDDAYVVDDAGDVVVEAAGEGTDEVTTSISWTLADNIEIGRLSEDPGLDLTGNALANTLHGNDWDNRLDGGLGADNLYGYAGDDTYYTDTDSDRVYEAAGEGTDTVVRGFGSQYILADNVENLRLTDSAGQGNGNALDNLIEGSAAANALLGLDGNDELRGMAGNDTLWGGNGSDLLLGGEGDDIYVIDASTGSDVIDNAGGGSDTLLVNGIALIRLGFARDGNDLLVSIDGAATPAARIAGHFLGGDATLDYVQGSDNRYSAAQIAAIISGGGSPGTGFDQTLTGTAAGEQLVGSAGKDLIEGLAGADTLFGMGGNDTLRGGDGNDYLSGGNGSGTGSGDDVLEGGLGNDTLRGEDGGNTLTGGAGDDQYVYGGGIDVINNTGGGTDWLFFQNGITVSQLAFTRSGDDLVITVNGNASQRVTVTGHFLGGDMALDYLQPASGSALNTAAINALVTTNGGGDTGGGSPGTGNDADYPSVKTGTANGEQIVGTSGRDLIKGLAGDDTLFGMGADDKLDGGDGNDYLSGGNGSFSGSGTDILIGGAGDDQLVGEDGDDVLFGGAGNDTYFYAEGSGADIIDNTGGGTDWLYLDAIARTRLTYHRDGDDLIVRVDGDAGQQMRVVDHFLGGEHAIAYVQPGDGGYAISAATIAGQLTPLATASRAVTAMLSGNAVETSTMAMDEASGLGDASERFAVGALLVRAPIVAASPMEAQMPAGTGAHTAPLPIRSGALPIAITPSASPKPLPGRYTTIATPSTAAELQHLVDALGSFSGGSEVGLTQDADFEAFPGGSGAVHPAWTTQHRMGITLRTLER